MNSLTADFDVLRTQTYDRLLQPHRIAKYPFAFLGRISPKSLPEKIRLLDAHYLLMREVDDIIDGDAERDIDPEDYIKGKVDFLNNYSQPSDLVEILLSQNHEALKQRNPRASVDLQEATKLLFEAWEFDSRRIQSMSEGTPLIYSSEEIERYITNMELYSIMQGALAILGEDTDKIELLKPLVLAGRRHHYFLRDVAEDVADGCINISREEIGEDIQYLDGFVKQSQEHAQALGLMKRQYAHQPAWRRAIHRNTFELGQVNSIKDYFNSAPGLVQHWAGEQVRTGLSLLREYEESNAKKEFGLLTRVFLHSCYESRAKNFFAQMEKTLN